jgi:FkbM family methyltransferase
MPELQNKNKRPEDRKGLTPGSRLSRFNVQLFRRFAAQWRKLPNFRGKVRIAKELKTKLGLDNHHIIETVNLSIPARYCATLDLHSWHEFVTFVDGTFEEGTVRFLTKCYDGSGCFLDIGANIGLISLPFANLVDPSNSSESPFIFCVEAVRSNYERLLDNIKLNRRDKAVVAIGEGVGDCQKSIEIQVEGNLTDAAGTGTANILADGTDYPCERIKLTITTLDKLIEIGKIPDNCSLIKIDVDGYDLFVLQGAKKLLSSSRPIIFGEFNSHCLAWHGHSHRNVAEYVKEFDYDVFWKSPDDWEFFCLENQKIDQDLLLVPREKMADLSWCCRGSG